MRKLTPIEESRLEKTTEETFFDECQIGSYSETTDSYGDLVKSWNYGPSTQCGITHIPGYEKVNGELVFTGVVARVRLPKNTVISTKDRIKIGVLEYGVKSITGKNCVVVDCEGISA